LGGEEEESEIREGGEQGEGEEELRVLRVSGEVLGRELVDEGFLFCWRGERE
jgi:hypothetical protein